MLKFKFGIAATLFFLVVSGCASKKELKISDHLKASEVSSELPSQVAKFEKEIKDWEAKTVALKSRTMTLNSKETYINREKAIDDIEGQMKSARLNLHRLKAAQNAKAEFEARNGVLENLTTVERVYRQIAAAE